MEIGYKDIYTAIGGDKTEGLKSSNIILFYLSYSIYYTSTLYLKKIFF